MSGDGRLADSYLLVTLTEGMSLAAWERLGILEREIAIYRRLRPHLAGIGLLSWGGSEDLALAGRLAGLDILCNRTGLEPDRYRAALIDVHGLVPGRVAVVKTNQMRGADVAIDLKRRLGCPLIARCGFLWSYYAGRNHGERSPQARRARAVEARAFAAADVAVVTSAWTRECVARRYDIAPARIRVVPNYVLAEIFRPGGRPDPDRVCYVGRDAPEKNLDALIEAMAGLPATLAIVGRAAESPRVREAAARAPARFDLVGTLPHRDLPRELRRARVFVQPSRWEGHPKALLEAMSCGIAVVGADVVGINDVIASGETGLLAPPTAEGLRSAIHRVLGDDALADRLGTAASRFIADRFALDRVLPLEVDVLEHVMASTMPP
jgi:glycosyltransferase involved in cell wall biosynthesis